MKIVDLKEEVFVVNSDFFNVKLVVLSFEVSLDDIGDISFVDFFIEFNIEGLCLLNGDWYELNEVLIKCVESENCCLKEDKFMYFEID